MSKIEWEKDVPIVVAEFLRRHRRDTTRDTFEDLRVKSIGVVTSMSDLRNIAKIYSRRYKVPIRISEKPFGDLPQADACYEYQGKKTVIYLHPILTYYPERYIRGVIEHELDHARVESKWEDIL